MGSYVDAYVFYDACMFLREDADRLLPAYVFYDACMFLWEDADRLLPVIISLEFEGSIPHLLAV